MSKNGSMHACQMNAIRRFIDGIDMRIDSEFGRANRALNNSIQQLENLKAELEMCGGVNKNISYQIMRVEEKIVRLKERRRRARLI